MRGSLSWGMFTPSSLRYARKHPSTNTSPSTAHRLAVFGAFLSIKNCASLITSRVSTARVKVLYTTGRVMSLLQISFIFFLSDILMHLEHVLIIQYYT